MTYTPYNARRLVNNNSDFIHAWIKLVHLYPYSKRARSLDTNVSSIPYILVVPLNPMQHKWLVIPTSSVHC